jgi:ADP-heptose:LPS heptosyltransferase
MTVKSKIIVLRFSAMGDVAMVASVLKELVNQNPNVELVMVSRKAFEPFFTGIDHLTFHAIEPKTLHRGFLGLYQLYKELSTYKPIAIADLHDNLRSRLICTFFRLAGVEIKRIDKGRAEKKALTRTHDKIFKPLKQTVERYADVFRALKLPIKLAHRLVKKPTKETDISSIIKIDGNLKNIGISPFAQHIYKMYPLKKMEQVIALLDELNYQIFIFGGGNKEKAVANEWENQFKNVKNLITKFTLTEELLIIANLDLMVSMDSAGMHMASLMGTKVVSIWGPTHPYAGFLGYGQSETDCIQIDHPNRPNSVYGNKPCFCGDVECMELIDSKTIVNQINKHF